MCIVTEWDIFSDRSWEDNGKLFDIYPVQIYLSSVHCSSLLSALWQLLAGHIFHFFEAFIFHIFLSSELILLRGSYILLVFLNDRTFGLLIIFFFISLFNLLLLKSFFWDQQWSPSMPSCQSNDFFSFFFILPDLSKTFPITAYCFIFCFFLFYIL